MDRKLRLALMHIRRINGCIGGYPAGDGNYYLTLEYCGLRLERLYLAWPVYLGVFAFWQELLTKPARPRTYRQKRVLAKSARKAA